MVVIHTSGSTSAPKGVTHTHGQVIRNMARQNGVRRFTDAEVLLSNSPWFWVGGLAFSFLATLIAGAKLVCSSAAPAAMLDLIEAERYREQSKAYQQILIDYPKESARLKESLHNYQPQSRPPLTSHKEEALRPALGLCERPLSSEA